MKIGIDARIIFRRGVGRYISNLVRNLLAIDSKNQYILYIDKKTVLTEFIKARNLKIKRLNTSNAFIYEQLRLPMAAAKDRVDILHGTDNTLPYMFSFFRGIKAVTIHDTMFIRPISKAILKPTLKQWLTDAYNKRSIPASAACADGIITVSEYSANDIIKHTGASPVKISVIKEGVEPIYRKITTGKKVIEKTLTKFSITKPYLLFSAASDKRKNAGRVLEAFNIFNNMCDYKYKLVITSLGGKEILTTNIPQKIKEFNLDKYIVNAGYVSDEEMVNLYNGAAFFLFPSIWEGFGLQVLEAYACGTPVLTSNNTSLKEIAGGAACFVDPFSVEDIVKGMITLHRNPAKRAGLVKKGKKQVKNFSWKKTAEQTLEFYRSLAGGSDEK